MAYGVKYRFPFESVEGIEWTIDILKDGYSGTVNIRPVGGSPMLRKDKNDNICGTSLDLTAECNVDGEYEEFSSSNPFSFQVKVYRGSTLVWQGYVSPELYNAPDIAPPYDVRVTATDGLGELKLHYFEAQGRKTLSALLTYLLGFTGLNLGFRQITDLSCSASGAANMLSSVYVNIDFLAGETCYDVLQYLLGAIHSTITQDGSYWLIQKETGMAIGSSAVSCYVNGVSSQRSIEHFGSMTTHTSSCWPVGHMTREYVAPKKKMIVTADNHYRENILGTWTPNGNASNEGDYWLLPAAGDGLSQTITFQQEVSKHLVLSIKVRNVGEGEDAGNIGVYVKLDGSYYQSSSYLYLSKYTGKRRRPGNDAIWSTVSSTWDAEVQAPSETDTDQDYVTIDLVIPLYDNGERSYVYASSLEIQVFNGDQLYPKRVYDVSLYQYEQTKGFKKVVNIDNGARGESPDVYVIFPCTTDLNDYNGAEEMLYGMPVNSSSAKVSTWTTGAFSSLDYLSLIARDYALSIATPRVRVSGVLQTPSSGLAIPVIFVDDHDNVKYIVESFSWDLYNDEVSVQMISEPAASITVDGDETMEGETENPTGHQQSDYSGSGGGGSYTLPIASATVLGGVKVGTGLSIDPQTGVLSSSGGGGGGGLSSVGLEMPSQFSVNNTPLTANGTISVSLKNTYTIPSAQDWAGVANAAHTHGNKSVLDDISSQDVSSWDDAASKAHSHSNKSVLDDITSQDVSGWDDAASKAHSHSNKSVLDGITSQKVSQWDAAASGDTIDVSIGGTNAAPTVQVALGTGDSDSEALPIADASKSGLVSTGNQTFSGNKTFDRIYLGNSAQYGMYIEWDNTNHMFKIVGDVYATGDVAAGG